MPKSTRQKVLLKASNLGKELQQHMRGELDLNPIKSPLIDIIRIASFLEKENEKDPAIKAMFRKIRKSAGSIPVLGNGRKNARLNVSKKLLCPICLTNKKLADSFILGCGHGFCKQCLINWIDVSKDCPYCRSLIETVEGDHDYDLTWVDDQFTVRPVPYEE